MAVEVQTTRSTDPKKHEQGTTLHVDGGHLFIYEGSNSSGGAAPLAAYAAGEWRWAEVNKDS